MFLKITYSSCDATYVPERTMHFGKTRCGGQADRELGGLGSAGGPLPRCPASLTPGSASHAGGWLPWSAPVGWRSPAGGLGPGCPSRRCAAGRGASSPVHVAASAPRSDWTTWGRGVEGRARLHQQNVPPVVMTTCPLPTE